MRVVHVDTGREWRGGQSQVLMLARGMKERGSDVWIAARKGSPLAQRAAEQGVSCVEFRFRFEADPGSAFQLSGLRASGSHPTIYHAHTPHALGVAILAGALGAPVRILFTRRVAFPLRKFFVNRWKLNQADRIIAVSETVASELRKGGVLEEKIRVVHSAIDTDIYSYHGPMITEPLNVVVLGAIEKAKGISEAMRFIELARELAVRFHFIGSGQDLRDLEKWAAGQPNVRVHGFVSDVAGFLPQMFGAISFSPSEGFPNLILQAMATGLPVAAFRNEAVREIFGAEAEGQIFATHDEGLAIIRDWMSHKENAMAAGRRFSEHVLASYSHNRMVENTLAIYKELAS